MSLSKETIEKCLLLLSQVDFRVHRSVPGQPKNDDLEYESAMLMRDELLECLEELSKEDGS